MADDDTALQKMKAQRLCLDLAMQACLPPVESWRVAWTCRNVDRLMAEDDPLRIALAEFAARFPVIRHDPEVLQEAGQQLFGAVRRSTWPVPCDRADLEG